MSSINHSSHPSINKIIVSTFGILILEIFAVVSTCQSLNHETENEKYFGDKSWSVSDLETGISCVRMEGDIHFKVNEDHFKTGILSVPHDATASGHCSQVSFGDYQDIKLSWTNKMSGQNYSLYFGFDTNWESEFSDLVITSEEFALTSITFVMYGNDTDTPKPISYSVSDFIAFPTPKNACYLCSSLTLREGGLEMNISNFRLQVFNVNQNGCQFDVICPNEDKKSVWDEIAYWGGWILVGFLGLCIIGMIISLGQGIFNRRQEIAEISYRFLGSPTRS